MINASQSNDTPFQRFEAFVKHWVTFVEGHVKMVVVIGAILLFLHFGNVGLTAWENHDKRQLSATQQAIKTSDQTTKDLEAQIADLKLTTATQLAKDQATIASLRSGLQSRVKINDNLPLTDLSARWVSLLALGPGTVQETQQGDSVTVSSPAAHATVNQLEQVPVLTQQNTLLTGDLSACNALSSKKDVDIANLHTDIALRDKEIAQQKTAISDARHEGERKGFKWGSILTGAVILAAKIAGKI